MLTLETAEGDDQDFLDLAARAIIGTALREGLHATHVVHIDNWFGPRWWSFAGKVRGKWGARDTMVLRIPPFHPQRVLSEKRFSVDEKGSSEEIPVKRRIHGHRRSTTNLRFSVSDAASEMVFAWYSGNSIKNGRAALMVYVQPAGRKAFGWYVGLKKEESWRVVNLGGLTQREWQDITAEVAVAT
jgi:hypothetical protein